ncbi:unnamed protein product [Prorocentrum cordatum]|uniref:Uncharacterized protein n=1 Tax=Prorocentrum cordatum TaxID=2364126 RepID=A0ABN9PIH8_9DINO|nr:unnamed protein product [Polarella glacialis]
MRPASAPRPRPTPKGLRGVPASMGEQFKWNPSAERMGDMMQKAVYMEDHVTFQHLLNACHRANLEAVDESGATALHIAATHGKTSALAWLLECGADLRVADDQGYDALAWACCKGHQSTVVTLLQSRASPEAGAPGLHEGELLRARAPLEQTNKDGVTALMSAAHTAETEVVASLLSMQALRSRGRLDRALLRHERAASPGGGRAAGEKGPHRRRLLEGIDGRASAPPRGEGQHPVGGRSVPARRGLRPGSAPGCPEATRAPGPGQPGERQGPDRAAHGGRQQPARDMPHPYRGEGRREPPEREESVSVAVGRQVRRQRRPRGR